MARQHHILPAFYLAGFSDTGTRDGIVHVFDQPRGLHYKGKPDSVGSERDFYGIHAPAVDPQELERSLSELESELAPVLQRVIKARRPSSPYELGELLSLVA